MKRQGTVLAVGAHPDDNEGACGGTLAKYAKLGWKVIMVCLCNGDRGHDQIPPEELAKIREKEARNAAAIIGAELVCMGIPDGYIALDQENKLRMVEIIRRANPDVVITQCPRDGQPDHRFTGQLVFEALQLAPRAHLVTDSPPLGKYPILYYMTTNLGLDFYPTEYVDISDTFETKKAMALAHKSLLDWIQRTWRDYDWIEIMEIENKWRGIQ